MVAGEQRNRMSAASGKLLRSDDTELDLTALLDNVYDAVAGVLKTSGGGGSTEVPTSFDADLYDAPAANTAAEVEIAAAGAGVCNVIRGIAWSYNAEPTGGNLKIEDGATVVFSMDIATAGAGFVPVFGKGSANTALMVTLAAGGAEVSGKLNVLEAWTE